MPEDWPGGSIRKRVIVPDQFALLDMSTMTSRSDPSGLTVTLTFLDSLHAGCRSVVKNTCSVLSLASALRWILRNELVSASIVRPDGLKMDEIGTGDRVGQGAILVLDTEMVAMRPPEERDQRSSIVPIRCGPQGRPVG